MPENVTGAEPPAQTFMQEQEMSSYHDFTTMFLVFYPL